MLYERAAPSVRHRHYRGIAHWVLGIVLGVLAGCDSEEPNGAPGSPASASTPAGAAASATAAGIPPELVQTVEKLILLTTQYNELAAKVLDVDSFNQHRDELSRIEHELSPLVEQVMIGESKLTPDQNAQFQRDYYESRAKPLVEAQRRHKQRIFQLVP